MYKFIKTKNPDNEFERSEITFQILDDDIGLPDLLGEFHRFLKACGYNFKVNEHIVVEESDV